MSKRVSYRKYYGNRLGYVGNVEVPVFLKLSEVEKVLTELEDTIKHDGHVTLAKFYELTGGTILNDDVKFGWKHLLDCQICIARYGYELQMPVPEELNVNPVKEAYEVLCRAERTDEEGCFEAVDEAISILSKTL